MRHALIEALGWSGSLILVVSVAQTRQLRFRVTNLLAVMILGAYTAIRAVWPMVAVNIVLTGVNVYFLIALLTDGQQTDRLDVGPSDAGDHIPMIRRTPPSGPANHPAKPR